MGDGGGVKPENAHVVTLRLKVPEWRAHLPGQHYVVRLTADDGYSASRSYSVSSPPEDTGVVELTVDRLPDGEVSPYLTEVVMTGDEVEVRGPIGGYFAWRGESPLLLVAGGSGVAPVMAMLRSRRLSRPQVPVRLLFSVRNPDELIFADELGPGDHDRLHPSQPGRVRPPRRADHCRRRRGCRLRQRAGVRVRLVRFRRGRVRPAGRLRLRPVPDPRSSATAVPPGHAGAG